MNVSARLRQWLSNHVRVMLWLIGAPLAAMWCVLIFDRLLAGSRLQEFGIRPRHLAGLVGIPLAPFLHGDFSHLAANTIPFAVLGSLMLLRSVRHFLTATLIIVVLGGLGVWLFGSNSTHIGASGLIFGYFGFLILRGWFERSVSSVVIALIVILLYGGLISGVMPGETGASWENHLCGFLAGCVASQIITVRKLP